jgi:serine/threonine-protein kinase
MGEVFLARQEKDSQLVVIKTLPLASLLDGDRRALFVDEMRIAKLLRHANIVQLLLAGDIEGCPYLVMEFINGPSLLQVIGWLQAKEAPVDLQLALSMASGICRGLHYAHELTDEDGSPLQLVHRDISPHNLMINDRGVMKIVDFGVAKAVGQQHVSVRHGLKGKICYMAPEYVSGRALDRRADIFALGVVLWELFTRRKLFPRVSSTGTIHAILNQEIDRPSKYNDAVPRLIDRAIMGALERNPSDRWPSARAFGLALEACALPLGGLLSPAMIQAKLTNSFPGLAQQQPAEVPEGAEKNIFAVQTITHHTIDTDQTISGYARQALASESQARLSSSVSETDSIDGDRPSHSHPALRPGAVPDLFADEPADDGTRLGYANQMRSSDLPSDPARRRPVTDETRCGYASEMFNSDPPSGPNLPALGDDDDDDEDSLP